MESVALDGFVSDADGSPADDVGPDESAEATAQPHAVIAAAPTATSVTRTPPRPRAPARRVRPRGRPWDPDVGYQFAAGGEIESVRLRVMTQERDTRPRPRSTLTGCWETTSAPAQYSGVGEPGMFEIVVLNGGSTQPAAVVMDSTREVRANSAGGTVWFASCMRLAGPCETDRPPTTAGTDPSGEPQSGRPVARVHECLREPAHRAADMEVQVHFAVHPLRVRDTERHSGKAPAQRRQQVQPRSDQLDDVVTGHQGFVFTRLVEDDQTGDVQRRSGILGRQEECVKAGQVAHARAFRRAAAGGRMTWPPDAARPEAAPGKCLWQVAQRDGAIRIFASDDGAEADESGWVSQQRGVRTSTTFIR